MRRGTSEGEGCRAVGATGPRPVRAGHLSGGGAAMASSKEWFETVAEAQRRAKRRLPKSVYRALVAGCEQGVTLDDNVRAFSELGFLPHTAELPRSRDQATTVLGQQISLPVIIS